jgi:hypothetical protein
MYALLFLNIGVSHKTSGLYHSFCTCSDRDPNWENMTKEERSKSGIYVQMLRGFGQPGKGLKLKKSLYGLKQAPRNFFLYLKEQLEAIGFKS